MESNSENKDRPDVTWSGHLGEERRVGEERNSREESKLITLEATTSMIERKRE